MKSRDVSAYISRFPEKQRKIMERVRAVIQKAAPKAVESMGYGVAAFKLNGPLVYFAAFKKHVGLYPGAAAVAAFKEQLVKYGTAKGTIRFPLDKPVPYSLIGKIARYRVKENAGIKKKKA